jgi:hypothetical protein
MLPASAIHVTRNTTNRNDAFPVADSDKARRRTPAICKKLPVVRKPGAEGGVRYAEGVA